MYRTIYYTGQFNHGVTEGAIIYECPTVDAGGCLVKLSGLIERITQTLVFVDPTDPDMGQTILETRENTEYAEMYLCNNRVFITKIG